MAHIADLDEREERLLAVRATALKPATEEFFAWVVSQNTSLQPKTIQDTVTYAMNATKGLRVILEQAGCDLDNNVVERAIRTVAIGRKNWMFAGSPTGGAAAGVLAVASGIVPTPVDGCRRVPPGRPDEGQATAKRAVTRLRRPHTLAMETGQGRSEGSRHRGSGVESNEGAPRINHPGVRRCVYFTQRPVGRCGSPRGYQEPANAKNPELDPHSKPSR